MRLGADWRQVAVEPAPVSGRLCQPAAGGASGRRCGCRSSPALADEPDDLVPRRWAGESGFTATADGTTLAAYEAPAATRPRRRGRCCAMAAAERWGVSWEECEARAGFVIHGDKRLAFAALADDAARL